MPPATATASPVARRERRHYYSPSQRAGVQVSCWLLVAISVVMGIGVTQPAPGGGGAPAWVIVPYLALALADLVFTYKRMRPAGAWAQDDGVRIINPFSTTFVPWEGLYRFALKPSRQFGGTYLVCFAEVRGGPDVRIWGIQQPRSRWLDAKVDHTEQLVDELNALAVKYRAEPG